MSCKECETTKQLTLFGVCQSCLDAAHEELYNSLEPNEYCPSCNDWVESTVLGTCPECDEDTIPESEVHDYWLDQEHGW